MQPMRDQRTIDAALRTVFLAFSQKCFYTLYPGKEFLPNWHHEVIWAALSLCGTENNNRLLINLPPRHMKSELISVFYTAWLLGRNAGVTIISVCYGDDLTRKLSRDVRKIMQSDWYKRIFPSTRLSPDKCTETVLETTVGGGRRATTVRGEIIGHGADYIIIDDPHPVGPQATESVLKAASDWYKEVLVTRLTRRSTGTIIVVMQRSKPNDLTGYLLQTNIFRELKLPLVAVEDAKIPIGGGLYHERRVGEILHPTWLGAKEIEILKEEISPATFEALYQQDPKPNGGALLKLERFSRYKTEYRRSDFECVLQVWDCATSLSEDASFSVCMTLGVRDNKLLVIDVWRKRVEYPELRVAAYRLVDDFAPSHIVVEWASQGQSLLPDLRRKFGGPAILRDDPKGDKLSRAESVIRHFMSGKISLPMEAPFLSALSEEITTFPNGFYDDQVDCLVIALRALDRNVFRRRGIEYRNTAPKCRGYRGKLKPNSGFLLSAVDSQVCVLSTENVHRDLQSRRVSIHEEPHWSKEVSEAAREFAHDSQLARLDFLANLDRSKTLQTAESFRAMLQSQFDQVVPTGVFSAKDYKWVWHEYASLLLKQYAGMEW
jgi:predicted phage terminase large subunit-like protein